MKRRICLGSLLAAWAAVASAQAAPDYASLGRLPDFSGGWTPAIPLFDPAAPAEAPLTDAREIRPEIAARYSAGYAKLMSGQPVDRSYCTLPAFGGHLPKDASGSLEILYTPGRITIAVESGLVRRVYLRDTVPEGALPESRSGTSIGHWAGNALVVETSGLNHTAAFLPDIAIGRGAHVTERIWLKDANTLEVDTTTVAPEVLTAPLKTVNLYRRAPERLFTDFDTCVESDRSFDAASKLERFDATPPKDLPPPPSE
jgi:hypothetical protein